MSADDASITIKSGDTLSQRTVQYNREHGTNYTWQEVAEYNNLANPHLIHPGDVITFPSAPVQPAQPAPTVSKPSAPQPQAPKPSVPTPVYSAPAVSTGAVSSPSNTVNTTNETTVRAVTSGLEINVVTIGSLTTFTVGTFKADFYINGESTPSFSAKYYYSVDKKRAVELTFLGPSVLSGEGTKTFTEKKSYIGIAEDFTSAGTDSVYGGVSIGLGASVSGSESGGWLYNQGNIGADKGFGIAVPISWGSEHTNTSLKDNSIKVYKNEN